MQESPRSIIGTYLAFAIAAFWVATGAALSTRYHLVFSYDTLATVPPPLEVLAVSNSAFLVLGLTGLLFPTLVHFLRQDEDWRLGLAFALGATLPLCLGIARCVSEWIPKPGIWEVVWFAVLTGLSFGSLSRTDVSRPRVPTRYWSAALGIAVASAFGWWLFQSHWYYQSFRLGFNDFGHFAQRIANTANGRGFLLETPVLPTFWDHFNPGLATLVPVWWLWPSVYMVFALQSLSLAMPAIVVASIVRKLGGSSASATLWGLAWLLHPSIGQMNLAYTYGWHPITVALPLLLLAYRFLLSSRFLISAMLAVFACSFEEGVIVVVGCFAAAMFLRTWFETGPSFAMDQGQQPLELLRTRSWFAVFLIATVAFVVVYTTSGLATFQTGRFARLGGSVSEIVFSPLLKPSEFWGLLLRSRNASFLSLLFAPFLVAGIFFCRWHLLALALPIGVLIVWEHLPAQCIAFQYAACLFPILFIGCIENSHKVDPIDARQRWNGSSACLATGWVLCIFVGQMPWSQNSLIDVLGATYEVVEEAPRLVDSEDNRWLAQQIETVSRLQFPDAATGERVPPRVLSTGRIASHFVGLRDVETVGQFWQRRSDLSKLDSTIQSPLLRYDVLVLDFLEQFQQKAEETVRVRDEALQLGFRIQQSRFDIAVLVRD